MNDLNALPSGRNGSLVLECVKCTCEAAFTAASVAEAAQQAKAAGWIAREDGKFVCPKCPAVRAGGIAV